MTALLLLCVLVLAVLPAAYVAAALPAVWLLQGTLLGARAIVFNAGPVGVTVVDLVLITLIGKLAFSIVCRRTLAMDRPLFVSFAIFMLVNLLATLYSGVKVADAPVSHGMTALVRLGSEFALVPVLAQMVKSLTQARRCAGILVVTLAVLALIQFINFFGASRGFTIGEVQGLERGEVRYFGPMGDSVGSVLLLGYLYSLCASSLLGTAGFLGGIMLTAGLGAIFSAGVGTVLFLFFGLRADAARAFLARYYWLLPALVFVVGLGLIQVGQPLSKTLVGRLGGGGYTKSADQRVATGSMAAAMIADNLFTGVGYLQYESALGRYGGERVFNLSRSDGATANANNQILQCLADAGVPGLVAFGWLAFCAARLLRGLGAQRHDRLLGTFFLAAFLWLLAQIFGNQAAVWLVPGSYVARFLWIILGTGIAVARLLPSSQTEISPDVESDRSEPVLTSA